MSKAVLPGSGSDLGADIGRGMSPSFFAAWQTISTLLRSPKSLLTCSTWVILIVGFPPLAFTSSSGSYSVLPVLIITFTLASFASCNTFSSRSRAYASVSFSKTKCDIFHALKSFGNTVCGASRTTKSFDLGLTFVIDLERSDWQSSLSRENKSA